ncbi:hypothetical protein OE88DRAFT_1658029 [Heliocybe sulcata]|uniref:Nucleolar protein 12 n=1 Tax=Heliocybe sulcata TaxID=5364 RepID=A0A5C3NGJ1_9AGAM|nr:hypothetical protein OE88DRAFT_1658029 [Heliocybe sulcata]
MSTLSSFLLKNSKSTDQKADLVRIDKGLDVIFQSNEARAPLSGPTIHTNDTVKRKLNNPDEAQGSKSKRARHVRRAMVASAKGDKRSRTSPLIHHSEQTRDGNAEDGSESSSDESDSRDPALPRRAESIPGHQDSPNSDDSDNDSPSDPSRLVHESIEGAKDRKSNNRRKKSRYVPEDETAEVKDRRTVFIGNVPVDVAKNRGLMKQLRRHLLSFVPTAKIESTRCRSVAFQAPTSKLPLSDDEEQGGPRSTGKGKAKKQSRQHDAERASSWRDSKASKEDAELTKDEKKYLTPQEKKKIAFRHHELHPDVDTVNVYVVFAYPVPSPKAGDTMDPFEAARLCVQRCNSSIFSDHTLRVDHVGKAKAAGTAGSPADDTKSTLFVGNIDFACKEEDLRAFFEALMSTERGAPPSSDLHGGDDSGERTVRPGTWVTRVRIIRDKDTQLGKGFAYVQFSDRDCVDEVLGLEESKLKFAKRKLRVQRCRSTVSNAVPVKTGRLERGGERSLARANALSTTAKHPATAVPKGNPALGEKIAHLPKEARKEAKASDPDRLARRLAKKKARMALVKDGLKPPVTERGRMRKRPKTPGSAAGKESQKKRVRSDKSVLKKNTKK